MFHLYKDTSTKEVSNTTSIPYPYPENGAEEWFKFVTKCREEGKLYAFAILYGYEFAGIISVKGIYRKKGICSVDYWVAPPFWNKGIGTKVANKAVNFAFNELGLTTIESFCLSSNVGSRKVLEKNGFVFIKEEVLEFENHKGEKFSFYKLEKFSS